jgi:hypothetical protein
MRKRTNSINKGRIQNNSRRRQLLKRVHQKIALRRQHFPTEVLGKDLAEIN